MLAPLLCCPVDPQASILAEREEKLVKQHDDQQQLAQELAEQQRQVAEEAAANSTEAARLEALGDELQAHRAAVEAREQGVMMREQQVAAEAVTLQQQQQQLQGLLAEVQVR